MRRYDIYKEFNNQNFLEVKFDKTSISSQIVSEASELLALRNKLVCKMLLGKRKKLSSSSKEKIKDKKVDPVKQEAGQVEEISRNISNFYHIRKYSIF